LPTAFKHNTWEETIMNVERLSWIVAGEISIGDVAALASDFHSADLAGEDPPSDVRASDGRRTVPVTVTVATVHNHDDWTTVTVTVTLPSGQAAVAAYRRDERA
jgi:hypothetical protein